MVPVLKKLEGEHKQVTDLERASAYSDMLEFELSSFLPTELVVELSKNEKLNLSSTTSRASSSLLSSSSDSSPLSVLCH
jgi:hypothetical protein